MAQYPSLGPKDKDMTDQNEAKTKSIGYLPIEKVRSLKGWEEYVDKSSKLSILKTETKRAKSSVRDALKERLNESDDIDFVADGDRIRIFRVFQRQQRGRLARSLDLSSSFREEALEGSSDMNGLAPESEEYTPALDPVTERLMAIMREKGERG
jgi:hypothetical protein